jgi:TusA-related sulfurtransferase
MMSEKNAPEADALLDVPGASCAILTPQIRESIMALSSGQVLEVRSDDPAARDGVPAWSRLTGHRLIATVEDDASYTRFFLERK